jgi:tripartite-type tricarboxylate transporter receptor subunit TctC
MKSRLARVLGGALCVLLLGAAGQAFAEFPERPILLIVPFAPGGGVDVLARPFAKELGDALKQSVIVENKPSATGQIGATEVARSAADGYTLLISSAAFGTTPAFYPKVPYDPVKDFEPVTILASTPQVLVASNSFKGNSVEDILKIARAGDTLNFALSASTGIQALATHLMGSMANVQFTHVPYKGAGAAFPNLVGGQVDVMFDNPSSSLPLVKGGKLKLLATTGLKRMSVLPNTPAVAETLPGFEALNWFILAAPAGTPAAVLEKLHGAALAALNRPMVKQMLERDGVDALGNSRDEARKFLRNEVEKWTRIVKEKNLQVQ